MLRTLSVLLAAAALVAPVAAAFELTGAVIDATGAPVSRAAAWLSQDRRVQCAETDAGGLVRFEVIDVGPVELVARKDGHALGGFSGPVIGPLSIVLQLAEAGEVALRIIDHNFEKLAGARLRTMLVCDAFRVPVEDLVANGFPSVRSDQDGLMTIPDLPAGGHVRFAVSHHKYADTFVPYLPVDGAQETIVLYPGVPLRGRVTDSAGKGVPGARVSVTSERMDVALADAEVLTDAEGFYSLRLAPGEYRVAVRHPDYASPPHKSVTLNPGSDEGVADLGLLAPHIIEGRVVAQDNRPVGGVVISYSLGSEHYRDTLTRFDGAFRLAVPPGEGMIHLAPPAGFMPESLADIPVRTGDESCVTLSPLRLDPLPAITGTVRDKDGQLIPKVLISCRDVPDPVWTITDGNGCFLAQLGRMPDGAKVSFRAEHALRFLRREFKVDLRKPVPADVTLKPFEPDPESPSPGPGPHNDLEAMLDEPAPEIDCDAWINSGDLTLEGFRGKVVVLTFWGGFDLRPQNRDRINELRAHNALLDDIDDVVFVGIHDASTDTEEIRRYVDRLGIRFPVGRDAEPCKTFERYRVTYIPQTVLIDKRGVLRYAQTQGRLLELIKILRREE